MLMSLDLLCITEVMKRVYIGINERKVMESNFKAAYSG